MSATESGSGSSLATTIETDETSSSQSVEGETPEPESVNTGYFPDTGVKRLLMSFRWLLKKLSKAPALEVISSWLPGVEIEGSGDPADSEQVGSEVHLMAVSDTTPLDNASIIANGHGECSCFSCFQQRQMYLLWFQSQTHGQSPQYHDCHHQQTHYSTAPLLCSSCQRPNLPPRPTKPILHRFTAAVVLHLFTIALALYPHVKAILTAGYAWERRNHVSERIIAAVLVLYERVWLVFLWLLKLSGFGAAPAGGWGEAKEQRVRKWLVRTGAEVLGGVVDGMQMGVGVWGADAGRKGKTKTRVVGVPGI